jgi:hypothetical protein
MLSVCTRSMQFELALKSSVIEDLRLSPIDSGLKIE